VSLKERTLSTARTLAALVGKRILIAIPFLIVVAVFAKAVRNADSGEGFLSAGSATFGLVIAVTAFGIYLGFSIGPLIGDFVGSVFGRMFYPSEEFDEPVPMYSIPASRRSKGDLEGALRGYEEIAAKYPNETLPYEQMMEIAIVDLHDGERARSILHRAFSLFPDPEMRQNFQRFFDANITRLQDKPQWLKEQEERTITPPDLSNAPRVFEPDSATQARFHAGGEGRHGAVEDKAYEEKRRKIAYKKV
jgi:hypothetical protein